MSPTFDFANPGSSMSPRARNATFQHAPSLTSRTRLTTAALISRPIKQAYWGALRALDPTDGQRKVGVRTFHPLTQACFRTAEDCCLPAMPKEISFALDAATGKPLWHFQMGGAVYASPMASPSMGEKRGHRAGSSLTRLACRESGCVILMRAKNPKAWCRRRDSYRGL